MADHRLSDRRPPIHAVQTDHRSCGGREIDRSAPVISIGEVVIGAPIDVVFGLQADVDRWPEWRSDVDEAARLDDGPLRSGSSFRWLTAGLTIVSTVREVTPDGCTFWEGPASGIDGRHLWTYTAVADGVLVHTEESWSGPPVDADVGSAQRGLDASLATWRSDLKAAAEGHR